MARIRTMTIGVAVAAFLAAGVPAGAADTTFAAQAESAGLTLDIAGNDALDVAATGAAIVPDEARATAVPVALGGTPAGERDVTSDGALVTDPGAGEDRCLGAIPAPLSSLVGAGLACSDVSAEGDAPAASATAGVAELSVLDLEGAELGALTDVLATLPLDDVLAAIQEQLDGELVVILDEVGDQCVDALELLNLEGDGGDLDPGSLDEVLDVLGDDDGGLINDIEDALLDPLGSLASTSSTSAAADPLTDLIGELTGVLDGVTGTLPLACEVLEDLTGALADGDLVAVLTSGDLTDALAGAEGTLSVTLLETESTTSSDGDTVDAASGPAEGGAVEITVDIPLLDELLGDVLEEAVAPVLTELQELLSPLGDAAVDVPVVGELVTPLLDQGTIGDLVDGPLLQVGVEPGSATATGDLATEVTGGDATPAVVALDGTLFALPVLAGLDDALNDTSRALDDTLLSQLRDTPLVDLVSVTLLPEEVVDAELAGLGGTRATGGTASVQVLSALGDPLIDLESAPATAAVGVGPADTSTPVTPSQPTDPNAPATPNQPSSPTGEQLPVTGGGAALLGLAALGAAASLRRRG